MFKPTLEHIEKMTGISESQYSNPENVVDFCVDWMDFNKSKVESISKKYNVTIGKVNMNGPSGYPEVSVHGKVKDIEKFLNAEYDEDFGKLSDYD